jgi:carboxypeptidase C (cathepsin A)
MSIRTRMACVQVAVLGALLLCDPALRAAENAIGAPAAIKTIDRDPYSDLFFHTLPLAPLTLRAQPGPHQFGADLTTKLNGRRIRYRTTLAEAILLDAAGRPAASVYTTSFVLRANNAGRPVVFAFNGGPGAASVFVEYVFGPKRLVSTAAQKMHDPSNHVEDNPLSLLDVADLVFIDPVETGFSHVLPGMDPKPFLSLDGDSDEVTAVILNWLRVHGRLGAPIHIFGESYGSLRAVAVARDLARSDPAVRIHGIILAGTSLTIAHWGRAPSPMLLSNRLPMMASVAYHYGKIDNKSQTWEQAVERARVYSRETYLPALMQGYALPSTEFEKIVTTLPQIVGLPESYFRSAGKISISDFNHELLKDQGLVLDSNNGLDAYPTTYRSPGTYAAYQSAIETELHDVLKVPRTLGQYQVANPSLFSKWDDEITGAPALDVTLSELMKGNPSLRLLVTQGRYDMLTDLGTTEFMIQQTQLPRDRYQIIFYDGGHAIIPVAEAIAPIRAMILQSRSQ